jgi:hypothetical protein
MRAAATRARSPLTKPLLGPSRGRRGDAGDARFKGRTDYGF